MIAHTLLRSLTPHEIQMVYIWIYFKVILDLCSTDKPQRADQRKNRSSLTVRIKSNWKNRQVVTSTTLIIKYKNMEILLIADNGNFLMKQGIATSVFFSLKYIKQLKRTAGTTGTASCFVKIGIWWNIIG